MKHGGEFRNFVMRSVREIVLFAGLAILHGLEGNIKRQLVLSWNDPPGRRLGNLGTLALATYCDGLPGSVRGHTEVAANPAHGPAPAVLARASTAFGAMLFHRPRASASSPSCRLASGVGHLLLPIRSGQAQVVYRLRVDVRHVIACFQLGFGVAARDAGRSRAPALACRHCSLRPRPPPRS